MRNDLITTFHPQTNLTGLLGIGGHGPRMCDRLGGHRDQLLPLVEFFYNNNYCSSIDMALFVALYVRI